MSVQLTGESMQKKNTNFDYGFFKLENNHDKAVVRLLHENYDDFSRRPVHYVKMKDKKYREPINCLRGDSDPQERCPFCSYTGDNSQISKRNKRLYIEFLVYKFLDRDGKVTKDYTKEPKRMVWDRERKFDDKIFSLSSRYNPLCDKVFQVERFGEKGSTETEYDIYEIGVNKEDYPYELPDKVYNPDGVQVKDKTVDEMNYYLENLDFPPTEGTEESKVERRSDVAQTQPQNQQSVSEQSSVERRSAVEKVSQPESQQVAKPELEPVQQTTPPIENQSIRSRRSI